MKYRKRTLTPLSALVPQFVYVMCGARAEDNHRLTRCLPQMKFVGFEPDPHEYERLVAKGNPNFRYLKAAVAGKEGRRTFYVTRNAACSSLLPPDYELQKQFKDGANFFEVVAEEQIETVSLDAYLPTQGISEIDFLDLDTQGSELEIFQGGQRFLETSIVAIKCEVEFLKLYRNQPVFSDLDAYLRGFNFVLFDISRSRYRREAFPRDMLMRGQLLWGDAIYLRDHAFFAERKARLNMFKLCLIAAHLQFHDYALEIMGVLLAGRAGQLSATEQEAVSAARTQYLYDLGKGATWIKTLRALERIGLKRPMKLVGRLATQLGDRFRKDNLMTNYNWVD
jgi:FkbM family methyltransferase